MEVRKKERQERAVQFRFRKAQSDKRALMTGNREICRWNEDCEKGSGRQNDPNNTSTKQGSEVPIDVTKITTKAVCVYTDTTVNEHVKHVLARTTLVARTEHERWPMSTPLFPRKNISQARTGIS